MKLYLLRHGTTDWNLAHKLQGATDIPLNDIGRELARKTAQNLADVKFDVIYTSPLQRAYETAQILRLDRDIPVIVDKRLTEFSFGIDEGVTVEKRTPGCHLFFDNPPEYVPCEGAESFESGIARTKDFIESVLVPMSLEKPDATVMISGHGAMNKALFMTLCHRELKDFWIGKWQGNLYVNIFEINGFKYELLEEGLLLSE